MGRRHRRRERSTRRLAVIAVVVAILAGLFGAVALAGPATRDKLGIGSGQPSAYPPVPIPQLGPLPSGAPTPNPAGLVKALADPSADPALGDLSGVVVDASAQRGVPLWQRDGGQQMVPGSVTKLLTAAATLLTLNPTDRLATRVVPGPEPDSVVLVGGGDPTLTALPAGQNSVYPDPARIDDLAAGVREAVGRPISTVYTDTSLWTGPELAPSWGPGDVQSGDVAPMTSLMLDGGRTDPTVQDGQPRTSDPAKAAGQALAKALGAGEVREGKAAPGVPVLAEVSSPPVARLVEYMLTASDNVTAEAMARQVALSRKAEPSFDGAARAVTDALSQAGYDTNGLVLRDGSGLSPENRISTSLLGSVLASAAAVSQNPTDVQYLRPILTGLPVAGGGGTLADRFIDGRTVAGRGVVRAKTGTLTGASSLAGVVSDVDGRLLVFAFISNGTSPADARPKLDALAATLSRCGCRA